MNRIFNLISVEFGFKKWLTLYHLNQCAFAHNPIHTRTRSNFMKAYALRPHGCDIKVESHRLISIISRFSLIFSLWLQIEVSTQYSARTKSSLENLERTRPFRNASFSPHTLVGSNNINRGSRADEKFHFRSAGNRKINKWTCSNSHTIFSLRFCCFAGSLWTREKKLIFTVGFCLHSEFWARVFNAIDKYGDGMKYHFGVGWKDTIAACAGPKLGDFHLNACSSHSMDACVFLFWCMCAKYVGTRHWAWTWAAKGVQSDERNGKKPVWAFPNKILNENSLLNSPKSNHPQILIISCYKSVCSCRCMRRCNDCINSKWTLTPA